MFNSEEDYVLDFKAEDKRTQIASFGIEGIDSECSTISASENSLVCSTPTPPLFFKLKKAKVMIKKLPQSTLEKYDLNSKNISLSPLLSPRCSKRIGGKQIPGQYLSLHVNKPLSEILEKKKKNRERFMNTVNNQKTRKQKNDSQNKKSLFFHKYNCSTKYKLPASNIPAITNKNEKQIIKCRTLPDNSMHRRQNVNNKNIVERKINIDKVVTPIIPNSVKVNSFTCDSSSNRRSLHKRIADTRLINTECHQNPVESTLPSCPDVVIAKYNIPPSSFPLNCHNFKNTSNLFFVLNEPLNVTSHVAPAMPQFSAVRNNNIDNCIVVSTPQQNINAQVSLPFSTIFSDNYRMPITKFPKHNHQLSSCQSIDFNATASTPNIDIQHPYNSTQREFNVETFKVSHNLSAKNEPVIVNSPKVLVINQPSLGNDPLEMSISLTQNKRAPDRQPIDKENKARNDIEAYVESETDLELSDTENQAEPQVIKRIIYHTKSVQTKFTCNSSICGLVDSDEFNLNCFYCYDIFPLNKWLEFKEHIKILHHVEEKENQLVSDEDTDKTKSQNRVSINQLQERKVTKSTKSCTISTSNKDITLNNENISKAANTTEKVFQKLPLEPRLIAQRQNRTTTEAAKILTDSPKNSKFIEMQKKQSQNFNKSFKKQLLNDNKNNCMDEIISLDSDDSNLDVEDNVNKIPMVDVEKSKSSAFNKSNLRLKSKTELSCLKESFIKVPTNLNGQNVIKTLPKPSTQLLTSNGHKKPRYFVVKKIIKLPTTDTIPNINISKGMVLTKIPESEKDGTKNINDNNMPPNDENEDSVPKPTNGRGILFGVTNPMVVIEFLLKLKSFPELWRSQLKNNLSINYNEGIKKMCFHLNSRFEINITDYEMRLSIQRAKDWYCRILKNLNEHNKTHKNTEPYKHKFPLYFKILNQFLTSDVLYTTNFLPNPRSKCDTDINKNSKCMVSKKANAEPKPSVFRLYDKAPNLGENKFKPSIKDFKVPQLITTPSAKPLISPKNICKTLTREVTAESLIEFDADTLYNHESSGEEILEEFDETKTFNEKIDEPKKKSKKNHVGSFECDICRKTYKSINYLKRHKVLHFPPQFECGLCSQKFYFKRWAEKCSHLKKKKYKNAEKTSEQDNSTETPKPKRIWPKKIFRFKMICEICGASYRSIGSLNTHRRDKHLNQREKCIVCNFTALSNWRIVQHQKKRHIVEPGTVEELAKKSRARTDTKTPFSNEARQEFLWRREMRNKLEPGEIFYGCCKCRIVFNSRKEKVLHNKTEHPIKETTVFCLLCLPNKLLLSNSNCARRHYTDIHKVPWHEIDDLVRRTKPIFNLLNKDEIELLKASENYKELLEELLKGKNLEQAQKIEIQEDEIFKAVNNLPTIPNVEELSEDVNKIDVESTQEENVYVDCIIDHDYNNEQLFNEHGYTSNNEHNYSEEHISNEHYRGYDASNNQSKNHLFSHPTYDDESVHLTYNIETNNSKIYNPVQNDEKYLQTMVNDFVEEELVEQSVVVEECLEEFVGEEVEYY